MAIIQARRVLVVDTNTVVRGLANWESHSGIILQCCERREFLLLLSAAVLKEYRKVLAYPWILKRNPELTPENVESVLRRLRYTADYRRQVGVRFELRRDPDDQKFLELAIAGHATHIVTLDQDILSLRQGHSEPARQLRRLLPGVRIVRPAEFLQEIERDRHQPN